MRGACGRLTINFANLIELLILQDWIAQHVTDCVGRYELQVAIFDVKRRCRSFELVEP
jgi:hypothetical protein